MLWVQPKVRLKVWVAHCRSLRIAGLCAVQVWQEQEAPKWYTNAIAASAHEKYAKQAPVHDERALTLNVLKPFVQILNVILVFKCFAVINVFKYFSVIIIRLIC